MPIRAHTHHASPPLEESAVVGLVCVAWTLTDAELLTDIDVVGADADLVTVWVFAGAVAVCVWVWLAVLTCPAALETAWLAFWAALDTAPLVAPDPHPVSGTVAIPSTSAPNTSGIRIVRIIPARPVRRG